MAEPARLEQLTDDLKTPPKASSLFFGPSVSFDTISDPREGSQSLVIWLYKSLLCLRLKINVLNLVTRLAWVKTGILIKCVVVSRSLPLPFFSIMRSWL